MIPYMISEVAKCNAIRVMNPDGSINIRITCEFDPFYFGYWFMFWESILM